MEDKKTLPRERSRSPGQAKNRSEYVRLRDWGQRPQRQKKPGTTSTDALFEVVLS
jgi:hypothetical protein